MLADEGEPTLDTMRHFSELARYRPLLAERLETLRALAADAGVERLADGRPLNQELDQLIMARGWHHPAEVLDPEGNIGISYPELVRIARARAGPSRRSESPAGDQALAGSRLGFSSIRGENALSCIAQKDPAPWAGP